MFNSIWNITDCFKNRSSARKCALYLSVSVFTLQSVNHICKLQLFKEINLLKNKTHHLTGEIKFELLSCAYYSRADVLASSGRRRGVGDRGYIRPGNHIGLCKAPVSTWIQGNENTWDRSSCIPGVMSLVLQADMIDMYMPWACEIIELHTICTSNYFKKF